jgi:hypothetical protein
MPLFYIFLAWYLIEQGQLSNVFIFFIFYLIIHSFPMRGSWLMAKIELKYQVFIAVFHLMLLLICLIYALIIMLMLHGFVLVIKLKYHNGRLI